MLMLFVGCFVIAPLHAASKKSAKENPTPNRYCLKRGKWPYPPMKSPDGKYVAIFKGGEGDTLNVAVERCGEKRGSNQSDTLKYDIWEKVASDITTVCWSPVDSILYTATGPIYNSPAIHAWDVEKGTVGTVFHPRTKYVHEGTTSPEYADEIALRNVSSDGHYLIMDYDPDVNADKNNCGRYVVDTQKDAMIPYKEFVKQLPSVRFMDPYVDDPPGSGRYCP